MDGFARRKEQSKETIRTAAWELFSQFGVDKVSMADIARKAGVSQATIYNNFASKEALAHEFVTDAVEHLLQRVEEVLAPQRLFREKMGALIRFIAEMRRDSWPSPADSAIFAGSHDLHYDPEIRRIRTEAEARMIELLLGLVREGKGQGEIHTEVSEEALSVYFGAFMRIFTSPQYRHEFHSDPKLVEDLGLLMIHGLSGQNEDLADSD
jgi:AcrR family transcriptional regulator